MYSGCNLSLVDNESFVVAFALLQNRKSLLSKKDGNSYSMCYGIDVKIVNAIIATSIVDTPQHYVSL